MIQEGDEVKTNAEWNEDHEPIQGIVRAVKTLKRHKYKDVRNGRIIIIPIPDQYEYTTVLQVEGTEEELNICWFEKVA